MPDDGLLVRLPDPAACGPCYSLARLFEVPMSVSRAVLAASISLLVCRSALAQEQAAKPVPQEASAEEKAAQRGQQRAYTAAEWASRNDTAPKASDTPDKAAERKALDAAEARPAGAAASVGFGSPAVDAPGGLASASKAPGHLLEISGYAILGASWTQSDSNLVYIGRNNGFSLADARIEITARPVESLWMFLSLDGAVAAPSGTDPTRGTREVRLKDAYGIWAPSAHLRVQAGQFKAPQGIEELLEETDIKFTSRSLLSSGSGAPYSYAADPLSIGRQLGIGVGTDRVPLGPGGFTAQVAIMNGNGPDQLYNDSQYPSLLGRAAYDVGGLSVGLWGAFQPRATGDQPRVYRDNVFTAGADLLYKRGPLHAMLLAAFRTTRHVTSRQPDEVGLGLSGELAYRFGVVEPAVRLSYLDPSDAVPTDALVNLTAGLNFYIPGAPGRFTVDFTHRAEQSGRDLSNDSLELSAQVRF